MIYKKKTNISLIFFILQQLLIANKDVPNVIISENPKKEITTYTTPKSNNAKFLNINIKKLTTTSIEGTYIAEKDILTFNLPTPIKINEDIFVTNDLVNINQKVSKTKSNFNYSFDRDNKQINVNTTDLSKNIYIIKYNKITNDLVTLYRWKGEYSTVNKVKKILELSINEIYNNYDEILISKKKSIDKFIINGGEVLKLPNGTKEVFVYNEIGNELKKISLNSLNGSFGMANDTQGIILKNSNDYLKLGIGFENGFLKLKLKEWSQSLSTYTLVIKAIGNSENLEHKVIIIPPKHKLQILNNLDFDFGEVIKGQEQKIKDHIVTNEMQVQVPTNISVIKTTLKDNGALKMYHEKTHDSITARLKVREETEEVSTKNNWKKVIKFKIDGKIDEDITNKPIGSYKGSTEILVNVE